MTPSFDAVVAGLGNQGVFALKSMIADAWGSLSDQEKADCEGFLVKLIRVRLLEVAGQDVGSELQILEATLKNWMVVGKSIAMSAMRDVLSEMFGFAGAFAAGAVASFVKSMK